jgi:Spy/CpxP family protein refolding chaperone
MEISKVKIAIGTLIVTTLFLSSVASAHSAFGPGGWRMGTPLLEKLQLTDDQKAQLQTIFADGRGPVRALYRHWREKQTALRQAARTEPFDEALVRSQAQEVANLQAEMMVARAQLVNKVLSILTDEQKAKLDSLRDQARQRFREWRQQHLRRPEQPQS